MKSIAVLGAGAIGCFVGGMLRAAGHEVVFIGRQKVVDALQNHGLTLLEMGRVSRSVEPQDLRATADSAAMADCDLILVCVKSRDTEAAARDVADHAPRTAMIVSLQNGVSNARVLGEQLGPRPIAAGMVQFNIVSEGQGRFYRATEGGVIMKDTPTTRTLRDALSTAGVPASVHSDMQAVLWTKLLLNLNNGLNVLSDVPLKQQLSDPSYRKVLAMMVDEALVALHAAHTTPARIGRVRPKAIPFVLRLPTWAFKHMASALMAIDPQARSSMWDDLQIGRPSEIDYLNGEVVRLANHVGTKAPTNEAVIGLVDEAFSAGKSPGLSGKDLLQRVSG